MMTGISRCVLDNLVYQPDGCLVWTGHKSRGYGQVQTKAYRHLLGAPPSGTWRVHRLIYTLLVGPIPAGLILDHLCRNPSCANPYHLDPVTQRVNVLRGESFAAKAARSACCGRGHPFTPDNTRVLDGRRGRRMCLTCKQDDAIRYRARCRERRGGRVVKPAGEHYAYCSCGRRFVHKGARNIHIGRMRQTRPTELHIAVVRAVQT